MPIKGDSRRLLAASIQSLEPRRLLAAMAWDGGGDDQRLDDPRNWAGDVLPTAADDVTVETATNAPLLLTGALSVNSIHIANRPLTISATGALTAAAPSATQSSILLSGGQLSTASRFQINGLTSVLGKLLGGGEVVLSGESAVRPIVNGVSTRWSVDLLNTGNLVLSSVISFGAGGDMTNAGSIRFQRTTVPGNSGYIQFSAGAKFTNTGDLHVVDEAHIGYSSASTLDLGGTVHLDANAKLDVSMDGVVSAEIRLDRGATVQLERSITLASTIDGPEGKLVFASANSAVVAAPQNLGSLSIIAASKVRFDADCTFGDGDLTVGETRGVGKLTFTGAVDWLWATLGNTGGLEFRPSSTLHLHSDAILNTTLSNYGAMDLIANTGQGQSFWLGNGARLLNYGRFDVVNASGNQLQIHTSGGSVGDAKIENYGLLRFDNSGTSIISVGLSGANSVINFRQGGTVELLHGTVRLSTSTNTLSGLINIAESATLMLGSGYSVGELPAVVSNATIVGAGTLVTNWRTIFDGTSTIANLKFDQPTGAQDYDIGIDGRVVVTQSLAWGPVSIDGQGSITLMNAATSFFGAATSRSTTASIDNFGTLLLGDEVLELRNASLRNFGTMELAAGRVQVSGSGSVVNDGTVRQTSTSQGLLQGFTHRSGTVSATNLRISGSSSAPKAIHGGRFEAETESAVLSFDGAHRLAQQVSLDPRLAIHVTGGRLETDVSRSAVRELRVSDGAQFAFVPGTWKNMKVGALNMGMAGAATGSVEIGLSTLYVDYVDTDPSPLLASWARQGSSSAAGLVTDHSTVKLAVGIWPTIQRFFQFPYDLGNGVVIDETMVILHATSPGDLTASGTTDFGDLLRIAQFYGQTGRSYWEGNIDYDPDGRVDFSDLLLLAQNYGARAWPLAGLAAIDPPASTKTSRQRAAQLVLE